MFESGEIAQTQLDIVIDRLVAKSGIAQRLADSLDTALRYGKDIVKVLIEENEERLFTQRLICPACGFAYPELSPAFFSPNSPDGACPACEGLGVRARTAKKRASAMTRSNRRSVRGVTAPDSGLRPRGYTSGTGA